MLGGEFAFGPFRFDAGSRVLMRGNTMVPLTPKAAEVLALLLRNPGRVVEKSEILNSIWPGTFVEEGSLSQNIFQLRRVLGDSYIETVPRRGYRFVAPTAATSIAVLPFLNLTGQPELEYFSDGLTDEIISALTSVRGLRVPARSSAFQFKGRASDIREVGRVLNVSAVLEGTVRQSAGRFKVTAQLNSVSDGYCIWSDSYSRSGEDVLALESDIATAILHSLKLSAAIPARQPANPRAYELYLKGRYFWNQRPVGIDRAMDYFGRALKEDRDYALAHVGLADCYCTRSAWESGTLAPREGFPKAKELAGKAIEIDDTVGEAHTTLGYVRLHYEWDFDAAEADFKRAIQLNPGYPVAHHWYAHMLIAAGRTGEALDESNRALEIDPVDLITNAHMAWHFYYAGDLDAMESAVVALRELHPNAHWTEFFTGWLRERQGRTADAVEAFERAVIASGCSPVMRTALAHALAINGDAERARAMIAELESTARQRYVSSYELAIAFAGLRDVDSACRHLERAEEERSAWLAYIQREPRLGAVAGTHVFRRISEAVTIR